MHVPVNHQARRDSVDTLTAPSQTDHFSHDQDHDDDKHDNDSLFDAILAAVL